MATRFVALMLTVVVLFGACSSTGDNSPATVTRVGPITSTLTLPSVDSVSSTTATSTTTQTGPIDGVLPDGTSYTLAADAFDDVSVVGISAAVVVDLADGRSPVIGVTTFRRGVEQFPTVLEEGRLVLTTGGWVVEIDIYDEVQQDLGPDAETILVSSITARTVHGLPVLNLELPFRFASDYEIPLQMMVQYENFVVMRGCDEELGGICNATRSIQVVPSSALFAPVDDVPLPDPLWVESPAPRPAADPYFLDKGPLSVRGGHSVLWTGEEMLVWGGSTGDDVGFLVDGALFDPDTSTWRLLPPAPLDPQQTVAVWTGQELIVVGSREAATYRTEDGWRELAVPDYSIVPGAASGFSIELGAASVWDGDQMLIWSGDDMAGYDPITEVWQSLPAPPRSGNGRTLHADEGIVVAVGFIEATCYPLDAYALGGTTWDKLPDVDLGTAAGHGCATPRTTALIGGRLIAWDTAATNTRAMAFDFATGQWSEIDPLPLHSCESFPEPLTTDSWVLVFDYCDQNAALFEPASSSWRLVHPPGGFGPGDTIWTGQEVLMWGAACCYGTGSPIGRIDAWRWPLMEQVEP